MRNSIVRVFGGPVLFAVVALALLCLVEGSSDALAGNAWHAMFNFFIAASCAESAYIITKIRARADAP